MLILQFQPHGSFFYYLHSLFPNVVWNGKWFDKLFCTLLAHNKFQHDTKNSFCWKLFHLSMMFWIHVTFYLDSL